MPEDNVLVKLEHGKKSFGDVAVLKDISLEVRKGEVVAIIGPSGGGKSTLLRCMTLLETLDAGSLSYGDLPVAEDNGAGHAVYGGKDVMKRAKSRFGLVFQNFNLFPHYTVMKNIIDAPVCVDGVSKEEAKERAWKLLKQLGLSDKADAYPYQLSGGQQQRVSIARALALQPKVLFFDEPTSALDPELTGEVLRVIRQLADEHMTMVIVTHEMQFAKELSDRVIFMEKGLVCQEGTPEEVFGNPNARVKEFIGRVMQV